jgi:hypothetical protein
MHGHRALQRAKPVDRSVQPPIAHPITRCQLMTFMSLFSCK